MKKRTIPVNKVRFKTKVGRNYLILTATSDAALIFKQGLMYLEVSIWKRELGLSGSGKKTLLIHPDNYGLGSKLGVFDKDIVSFRHYGELCCGEVSFDITKVIEDENPWNLITIDGEIIPLRSVSEVCAMGTRLNGDSLYDMNKRLKEERPNKVVNNTSEQTAYKAAPDVIQLSMDFENKDIESDDVKPTENIRHCELYTDGSCVGNPGPAAWAFVIIENNKEVYKDSEAIGVATNNVAEYNAIINGLKKALELGYEDILVRTDSKYIIDSVERYASKWEQNGWKKADGSPVKNLEYLKELLAIIKRGKIKFLHIKGHNGDKYNELCDKMAFEKANGSS